MWCSGIVRPCAHRLGERLKTEWMAHLCGLCLALRRDHGQFARIVTNYDGLLVSVLTEAQTGQVSGGRRTAGPCALRGMRTASVAQGEGARLAAAVSLVLAAAKVRDHVADRDGLLARRPVAAAARRVATSWGRAGEHGGGGGRLRHRRPGRRRRPAARRGDPGRARHPDPHRHRADRDRHRRGLRAHRGAGRAAGQRRAPGGGRPALRPARPPAGRRGGPAGRRPVGCLEPPDRHRHLLAEARRLADDALHGIRLALRDAEFRDGGLVHLLLVHELRRSVDRAFGTAPVCAAHRHGAQPGPYGAGAPQGPYGGGMPQGPYGAGSVQGGRCSASGQSVCRRGVFPAVVTASAGAASARAAVSRAGSGRRPSRPRAGAGSGRAAGCSSRSSAPARCAAPRSTRGRGPRKKRNGCCQSCDCPSGCDCCCPCDGC